MTAQQAELAQRFGIRAPYPEDQAFPPPELFAKRDGWIVRKQDGIRVLDFSFVPNTDVQRLWRLDRLAN
jgi:hypothetical protein